MITWFSTCQAFLPHFLVTVLPISLSNCQSTYPGFLPGYFVVYVHIPVQIILLSVCPSFLLLPICLPLILLSACTCLSTFLSDNNVVCPPAYTSCLLCMSPKPSGLLFLFVQLSATLSNNPKICLTYTSQSFLYFSYVLAILSCFPFNLFSCLPVCLDAVCQKSSLVFSLVFLYVHLSPGLSQQSYQLQTQHLQYCTAASWTRAAQLP